MQIRPHKDEVAHIVGLLQSGDYETPEELASALIVAVANDLAKRDTYGVGMGLKSDDMVIPCGPFYDRRDAQRLVDSLVSDGLRGFIAPLRSPIPRREELPPQNRCQGCSHAVQFHDSRGCWAFTRDRRRCECRKLN